MRRADPFGTPRRCLQNLHPGTHLSGSDLDVEVVPLVGDLEDFGPGESVDAQSVSVDQEAAGTDT